MNEPRVWPGMQLEKERRLLGLCVGCGANLAILMWFETHICLAEPREDAS